MKSPGNDFLLLAGKILTLLMQGIMALAALTVGVVTIAVPFIGGELAEGFADGSKIPIDQIPTLPLIGLLLTVLAIVVALFVFFGNLRAMIDTVGDGEPFVPVNARRLNLMAWLMLTVQVLKWPAVALGAAIASWAEKFDEVDVNLDISGIDLSGILMVLVLFILARVFRKGTEMREEMEGTV